MEIKGLHSNQHLQATTSKSCCERKFFFERMIKHMTKCHQSFVVSTPGWFTNTFQHTLFWSHKGTSFRNNREYIETILAVYPESDQVACMERLRYVWLPVWTTLSASKLSFLKMDNHSGDRFLDKQDSYDGLCWIIWMRKLVTQSWMILQQIVGVWSTKVKHGKCTVP